MGNVSRVFYISDAFDGSWDPSRHARWPGWFNTVIEHFMMYDSPGKLQLQLYPQRLRNAVDYHRKSFWFIHQFWKKTLVTNTHNGSPWGRVLKTEIWSLFIYFFDHLDDIFREKTKQPLSRRRNCFASVTYWSNSSELSFLHVNKQWSMDYSIATSSFQIWLAEPWCTYDVKLY